MKKQLNTDTVMNELKAGSAFFNRSKQALESETPIASPSQNKQVPHSPTPTKNEEEISTLVYALLLSYAWHNDSCFPGQDRLAEDCGKTQSWVSKRMVELEKNNFLEIQRRGQGKTNIYVLTYRVKQKTWTWYSPRGIKIFPTLYQRIRENADNPIKSVEFSGPNNIQLKNTQD